MPRRSLIVTNDFPYHITNRSNNKEFFYVEKDQLWTIFEEKLGYLVENFQCSIHCFVLMGNHYHLILNTSKSNLGDSMKYLHREVARSANRLAGRENHFFGGRYKWSLINTENYYWNAVKYVYRNPVKANISKSVENYKFSTLNSDFSFRLRHLFCDHSLNRGNLCLAWLNEPFLKEQEEAIRRGLRRRVFKPSKLANRKEIVFGTVKYKKGTVTY